jgi:hypothetical protein
MANTWITYVQIASDISIKEKQNILQHLKDITDPDDYCVNLWFGDNKAKYEYNSKWEYHNITVYIEEVASYYPNIIFDVVSSGDIEHDDGEPYEKETRTIVFNPNDLKQNEKQIRDAAVKRGIKGFSEKLIPNCWYTHVYIIGRTSADKKTVILNEIEQVIDPKEISTYNYWINIATHRKTRLLQYVTKGHHSIINTIEQFSKKYPKYVFVVDTFSDGKYSTDSWKFLNGEKSINTDQKQREYVYKKR